MKNNMIPMFAISGNPTKQEICNVIEKYKEVGINSLMIYARSGLEVEYMSEDWFNICDIIIQKAKKLDMTIWIYDEYNWPSVTCNNTLQLVNKDYQGKYLHYEDGQVVICNNDKTTDILNPELVKVFFESTHEKYYKRYKKYFGTLIQGIFTDEPSFSYSCKDVKDIPFYKGMIEDYKDYCDRDLIEDYKNIMKEIGVKNFYVNIYKLLGDQLVKSFVKPFSEWCENRNIKAVGHFMCDDEQFSSTKFIGDFGKAEKAMTVCGIDDILFVANGADICKYFNINGVLQETQKDGMIELYAIEAPSRSIQQRSRNIWMSALNKINYYFLAVGYINFAGNYQKSIYFNPISPVQPDFEKYKFLIDEAEKSYCFTKKQKKNDLYLRYKLQYDSSTYNKFEENCRKSSEIYANVITDLINNQVQFSIAFDKKNINEPVLYIKDAEIYLEQTGEKIVDLDKWIRNNIKNNYDIVDAQGQKAKNIQLYEYLDGSVAVIDTNEKDIGKRKLSLLSKNKKLNFTLEAYKTKILNIQKENNEMNIFKVINEGDIDLSFQDKNFYRCDLNKNNLSEFVLDNDLNVKILLRNYKDDDLSLVIDGKKIENFIKSNSINCSLNDYYLQSTLKMNKGKHTAKVCGNNNELLYFPMLMLSGDFEQDNQKLKSQRGKVKFNDEISFYGKINLLTNIDIPKVDNLFLEMDTYDNYSVVYFDGYKIGDICGNGYYLKIPKEFFGKKIKVKVEQYSLMSNMYGEMNSLEIRKNEYKNYNELIFSEIKYGGIKSIKFCVNNIETMLSK